MFFSKLQHVAAIHPPPTLELRGGGFLAEFWINAEGYLIKIPETVGMEDEKFVEIVSGLKAGDIFSCTF